MHITPSGLIKNPISLAIAFVICCFSASRAQSGQYIQVWGGPQYVSMLNVDDYYPANFGDFFNGGDDTYRTSFGINYIKNISQTFGFQTGIYYSGAGQKYSGTVQDFYGTLKGDTIIEHYNSQVWMDYIRVPIFLRFNSILDEKDIMNISIYMGLQIGYLTDVRWAVNIPAPDSIMAGYKNFDAKKLFNSIDVGLGAGAEFNFKLSKTLYANLGIRFDKSLGNVESKFVLPDNAPIELYYPLSTKKETRPSPTDLDVRNPSTHIALGVYLALTYKIKEGPPPKHRPVDDLQTPGVN